MAEIDEKIAEAWAKSGLTLEAGPQAAFNAGYGMATEDAALRSAALHAIDKQAFARIAKLEALLSESRSWLQTHDERGVLRELDELCERVDGMLSP